LRLERLRVSKNISRIMLLEQELGQQFTHIRKIQRWVKAGAAYTILASAGNI
jgi:hypothetical protein